MFILHVDWRLDIPDQTADLWRWERHQSPCGDQHLWFSLAEADGRPSYTKIVFLIVNHKQIFTKTKKNKRVGLSCLATCRLIHPCSYFLGSVRMLDSKCFSSHKQAHMYLYLFWPQRNWYVSVAVIKSHLFYFPLCVCVRITAIFSVM